MKVSQISAKHLIKSRSELFVYVLLFTISLLPNFFFIFTSSIVADSISKQIGYFIISIVLLLFPFVFFKRKVAFYINGLFLFLAPLEIGSLLLSRLPFNGGYVLMILQTNRMEAGEFLSTFSFHIFLLLLLYISYFIMVFKYIKNEYLAFKRRIQLLISNVVVFTLLYAYSISLAMNFYNSNFKAIVDASNENFLLKFNITFPVDVVKSITIGLKTYTELINEESGKKAFLFYAKQKEQIKDKEIFVFVIGETARYSNFTINKYNRNTTPLLEKTNSLISFSDVYAEANNTETSLPILLTRANAHDFEIRKKEKSVIAVFNEAGFKTYWIGNQSFGNLFIQQVANQATEFFFTSKDFDYADSYDHNTWKYLDAILDKNEQKQFIVIHTLGSHFRYNFRYPPEFNTYKPSFEGAFDYNMIKKENKETLINTYDNSILYTDYFLANTIKKIDKLSGISYLYYISDHGENLFEQDLVLHGGESPTKYDLHVPLLVWTSEKYNEKFPDKKINITTNKDKKLSSSITFHSLVDMANLTLMNEIVSKSIASSQLRSDSIRYVLNTKMNIIPFH